MEKAELQKWYDQNKDRYSDLKTTLEKLIETLLQENLIPYHSVNGRVKERDSFLQKFGRKPYTAPEQVMDFAGLRIITYTTAEVTQVCEMIEREFSVDRENSGNKAADMGVDKVGYLSVHYIVEIASNRAQLCEYARFGGLRCEIQVRSLLQHAWAEIEHDRSYKFAGVLPKEIQRKFYLVAGALELMDQEFCALSQEIDRYGAHVKEQAAQGQLEGIAIDSTSLLQFLNDFFSECDTRMLAEYFQLNSGVVIDELSSFGIKTLQQLKSLLSQKKPEEWLAAEPSYIGILRDAMILKNPQVYFESAWQEHWSILPSDFEDWRKLGVNMKELGKYVDITSFQEEDEAFTVNKP